MKALSFMKKFIIFYSNFDCYDSVVVDAKSLHDACEIAQMFSRIHSVTILGIFPQSPYIKLHPHE